VAWVSETLKLNWTAAPRFARHGLTVTVTMRPPKLVVDVRCPWGGAAITGTRAAGSRTADGVALEVGVPLIATTAAAVAANAAHRRPGNLRRSPTPSGYRPSAAVALPPRQDTRMARVALLPPRAVTTSFLVSGCSLASAKVLEPARVSLSSTVALVPIAIE